jgi:hypothetical protein
MRINWRRPAAPDTNEVASQAAVHAGGSRLTTVLTAIALVFSGYSLWETSLKQADLRMYVTGIVSYLRDTASDAYLQPPGGFEVFAVPVTISNGGARDGAVLSLQLDVKNANTGLTARFEGTYTADATYFAATAAKRPKTPFSALVIAGRSPTACNNFSDYSYVYANNRAQRACANAS